MAGSVMTQLAKMPRRREKSTAARPPLSPMPTTEPTWQCVVLTGISAREPITTVVAAASSTRKPRDAEIFVMRRPRTSMIL